MKTNSYKSYRNTFALLRGILTFAALASFLALFPAMAYCESVTLAWDANQESDLKGYILYYGTFSGNYTSNIDVGNKTLYTISELQDGVTYYFAVTAYNEADYESDYSEELSYTAGRSNNNPANPITPISLSSGFVDTSYTFSTTASDQDNDPLEYQFDWGDGTSSSWGEASRNHAWSSVGTFCIKARAKDSHGALSGWSNCHTMTILVSSNQKPNANAGSDQTVSEGARVELNGGNSLDSGGSIVSYSWEQTDGLTVQLANFSSKKATFVAPNVGMAGETLTFKLTVRDDGDLTDVDACIVEITKDVVVDSDGDGVPDDRDDFPHDADEYLDTDGDGEGNNADTDDDDDGMPDYWELAHGLDPLKDDTGSDPDGDEVSNINEFNLGTAPNHYEGNFKPHTPVLLNLENNTTVSLTPQLETDDFNDPNINDVHSKTQWRIMRAFDDVCVFDVTTGTSLTSITIPQQILEEDSEYIWQVRFFDNHDTPSEWSDEKEFTTDFADYDTDKNGVPDVQEISETLDLDEDGTIDINQSDIKCVNLENGESQICISIRDAENAVSIASLATQDASDIQLNSQTKGRPNYFEFELLNFKVLVNNPGDETVVTIYLSKSAFEEGSCFKYDPVNEVWLDYSDYTEFSPNRQEVYLTLKDGGFGDADGIENGIIVDPLAFGSESDPNNGGSDDSPVDEFFDGIIPDDLSCFISTAADRSDDRQSQNLWHEIRCRELMIIFILILIGYIGKRVFSGDKWNPRLGMFKL